MSKEIERLGIPVVHCCSIVPISLTVGGNRIIPTKAIPYPFGDPEKTPEEEYALRYSYLERALQAARTHIDQQTVFEEYVEEAMSSPA